MLFLLDSQLDTMFMNVARFVCCWGCVSVACVASCARQCVRTSDFLLEVVQKLGPNF